MQNTHFNHRHLCHMDCDKENRFNPLQSMDTNKMHKLQQEINELKVQNKDLENYKQLMDEYNDIKPIGRESRECSATTDYDQQFELLQKELLDRDSIIADLEHANLQNGELRKSLSQTNGDLQDKNQEVKQLHVALIDSRDQFERLQQDITERNGTIQEYAKKYNALNKSNSAKNKSHQIEKKENENKSQQIHKLQSKVEQKNKRIVGLDKKCKNLQKRQSYLNSEMGKLKQSRDSIQSRFKSQKTELFQKQKLCASLENDIKCLNDEILSCKITIQSNQASDNQHQQIQQENDHLHQQIADMNDELLSYKNNAMSQEQYLSNLQQQNEALRHEMSDIKNSQRQQIREYEQQIEKLWDELSVSQSSSNDPTVTEKEVETETKSLDVALQSDPNQDDIQYLYFTISTLQKKLSESSTKYASAKDKLIGSEKKAESLKQKCRKAESERDQMHTTIIKIRDDNEHNINNLRRELKVLKDNGSKTGFFCF